MIMNASDPPATVTAVPREPAVAAVATDLPSRAIRAAGIGALVAYRLPDEVEVGRRSIERSRA